MKNFDPNGYIASLSLRDEDIIIMKDMINKLLITYPGADSLLRAIMNTIGGGACNTPQNVGYSKKTIKLDLPITDRCNLGCASCSHFAPLANDSPIIPVDDIEASLTLLSEKCQSSVGEIFILGGEPLLHPDLTKIIAITRRLYPYSSIFLVSNMLLFEKRWNEIADSLITNKIIVGFSKYGKVNDRQVVNSIKLCMENWIQTALFGSDPALFNSYLKSENPSYNAIMKQNCDMKTCLTLRGNYLYMCSPVTYLKYPNRAFGMSLKASKYDRIDIRDIYNEDEVLALSELPNPFCRHCDVEHNHKIAWRPSKKERSEWFL